MLHARGLGRLACPFRRAAPRQYSALMGRGWHLTRRWAPPRGSDCGEKRLSGRDALRWGCDLASWLDRSHEKANAFFRCAAVFSPSSRISDKMLDGLTWSVGCFFLLQEKQAIVFSWWPFLLLVYYYQKGQKSLHATICRNPGGNRGLVRLR